MHIIHLPIILINSLVLNRRIPIKEIFNTYLSHHKLNSVIILVIQIQLNQVMSLKIQIHLRISKLKMILKGLLQAPQQLIQTSANRLENIKL